MFAGHIIGLRYKNGYVRLTVEDRNDGLETVIPVYAVAETVMIRLEDFVWTQAGKVLWTSTDGTFKDFCLYRIREDWDGYVWTLEEAMQGGRKSA